METIVSALSGTPAIIVGVIGGVVLTSVVHAVRKIRRLISTGIVMAVVGGTAAGGGTSFLQTLLQWH